MKKEITYEELMAFIQEKKEESNHLYAEKEEYLQKHPMLPADTVLDEEKSVRWNRQEVLRLNDERKEMISTFAQKLGMCEQAISENISLYIQCEYDFPKEVADVVFSAAYEDGHAGGHQEVIAHIGQYACFAERIINAYKHGGV